MLGNLGHLSLIIALVAILMAVYAYYRSDRDNSIQNQHWTKLARIYYGIHVTGILLTVATLFTIIYFHHYEYQYAWKHSSNNLPVYYILSCFWEGQEGSFLVWIFWNALLGAVLIKSSKKWEASVMLVFGSIQLFLISMILGIHIGDLKLGSSPFMLLRDTMDSEIFKIDPGFIPKDGNGLNPLLQNIWMVIHPPIIFLGFALSGIPFAYAIAVLWKNRFQDFTRISSPWTIACVGVLGAGIIMGAYWAYETLNFGGYWNWDPVENAVLIPWLVFLGAIHGTVLYKRKGIGLALTLFLTLTGFILILYSTFLTRSGVLGNASVHSFTDLGLSGQLLAFLLVFLLISGILFIWRYSSLKENDQKTSFLSIEFWMLLGICLLGLSSLQILIPTSIPVFNVLLEQFGIESNLAPPVDQVGFYNKFQIWFAIGFCLISGIGQLFYWKKIEKRKQLENVLIIPVCITLVAASLIILIGKTTNLTYILLITAACYLLVVCIQIGRNLVINANNVSLGGTIAHLGMAIMLIGITYSAGHQRILSQNLRINAPESDLPVHTVQENLLLNRNIPKESNGYFITYKGKYYETEGYGELIPVDFTLPTQKESKKILKQPLRSYSNAGDTIHVNTENTYYSLQFTDDYGRDFMINPRMQNNPTMGYIASPDIKSFLTKDVYTHVTNFPDPKKVEWNDPIKKTIGLGDKFEANGLFIQLDKIAINKNPVGIPSSNNDIPLEAQITVRDIHNTYTAHPIFHIDKNRSIRLFPDEIEALGTKILLSSINPEANEYEITVMTSQRDWITIKSIEMPMISLLWLGSIIMVIGIGVACYYRALEAKPEKSISEYNYQPDYSPEKWKVIIRRKATVNP